MELKAFMYGELKLNMHLDLFQTSVSA